MLMQPVHSWINVGQMTGCKLRGVAAHQVAITALQKHHT
jgi:hypothetical protein